MPFRALKGSLLFACLAIWTVAPHSTAQAVPTNYTYTGNPFTAVSGPPYTTAMFITSTFTLSSALGTNLVDFDAFPLVTAFTAFAGVQLITDLTPAVVGAFRVSTDGAGAITSWFAEVYVSTLPPFPSISSCNDLGFSLTATLTPTCGTGDVYDNPRVSLSPLVQGLVIGSPGSWVSAAAPEPSAALLVLFGIAAVAWRGRVMRIG